MSPGAAFRRQRSGSRAIGPPTTWSAATFRAAGPNWLWVADITYVPTAAGFLFLAVVLDAWSRRIVGWAMATDLRTRLVLDALDMAVTTRKPTDVVHHSDQGCQYTSVAFGFRLQGSGRPPFHRLGRRRL